MNCFQKIALIPIAAKPYHAGHDELIRIASKENDEVYLYVSIADRSRTGEVNIDGDMMFLIWKDYIEETLPENVKNFIDYSKESPIGKMYKKLESLELGGSSNVYTIYSDANDINKHTDEILSKCAPILFANRQILRKGVERTSTVEVSGTEMREFIEDEDVIGFTAFLPPAIQKNGHDIFNLLIDDIAVDSINKKRQS